MLCLKLHYITFGGKTFFKTRQHVITFTLEGLASFVLKEHYSLHIGFGLTIKMTENGRKQGSEV